MMNSRVRQIFLVLYLAMFCSCGSAYASKWDVEYWQYLHWNHWQCGPYRLYTIGEFRANHDLSKFYYLKFSENFAYEALPWLDLEAHYCYVNTEPRGTSEFTYRNRIEFEMNPKYTLQNDVELVWRNRIEFVKKQNVNHLQYVCRSRLQASYPIDNCGPLIGIDCSDEIFYDPTTKMFTQNRFIPIEMSFALSTKTTLHVFFMIRHFFTSNHWYNSAVCGSELEF